MGAGMSNPVDDSLKNEIQEFIKDSVATFGLEYAKSYATAAWYFARMEARKEPKPWKLTRRPVRKPTRPTAKLSALPFLHLNCMNLQTHHHFFSFSPFPISILSDDHIVPRARCSQCT